MSVEYTPNREICLPELLFSEIVPSRDPRLLAVRPASSIYFDMAKAFAKGIPPEDWYEAGPDEDDWKDASKKLLVHLPVNNLCRAEKMDTVDGSLLSEHAVVSCAESGVELAAASDVVVSATICHLPPLDAAAAKPNESRDYDSDDEKISRVIQSCMEPVVVSMKAEPVEDSDQSTSGQFRDHSPTVRSTMAVTEGKAQRLLKLKQSGISPEMLRRRLQKIEEKLSALRSRSKAAVETSESGQTADTSASELATSDQTVSKPVDENIPQKQSDNSAAPAEDRRPRLQREIENVGRDVTAQKAGSLDGLPLNLKVDTTSTHVLHTVTSEPLSGSSVHSDHSEVSHQRQDVTSSSPQLQVNPLRSDDQVDPSSDHMLEQQPWYVGNLSLDTKWDSQFIESPPVRQTLLEAMRNWRVRKPLDLIMSGQLWDVPLDWTPMKTTLKTDSTVECCWNSVLWYFGALLGEPDDSYGQQLMTSSAEEDVGTNRVQVPPDDDTDDWWGIGRDKAQLPAIGPVEDRQQTVNTQSPLLSPEKPGVPLHPSLAAQKSSQSALEPTAEKIVLEPSSVVNSTVSPSEKLPASAPVVDGSSKSLSRSSSSRKEKSDVSDVQKLPEPSAHSSTKPSSQKHKRKREDKKKSKRKLPADGSSDSTQTAKDSERRDQDRKKESKRTTSEKEKEKHSKKSKKHKQDVDDVGTQLKKQLESFECNRADISDLLRLFVGSDENKLSLLSKAICSAKQFNSHKLTTSMSLHWAVALALLDENASEDDHTLPTSLWSQQHPDDSSEANKGMTTESSVKRVFDSVSDFMNAVLSGKSAADFSDAKPGAANGLSASHLDELRFSDSDNGSSCSPTSLKIPLASKIKVEVDSEGTEEKKIEPVSGENADDDLIVEEVKKIKVDKRTIEKQKFVLPEESNENRKVLLKQASILEGVKVRVELEHKEVELKTGDEKSKEDTAESDDSENADAKQLQKLSSVVGQTLTSLRDEHSRLEDKKESRHHHHKKESIDTADKGVEDSSTSRQTSSKRKHGSSHHSERESSKHSRHEKKSSSHDRHKRTPADEKHKSRDRPFTSSFETISDTELDGQSTSANTERMSRARKQHSRADRTKTAADDKPKTDDAPVDSPSSTASRSDKNTAIPAEKLPSPPVSISQPSVTSTSGSSSVITLTTFRPSAIYKMANSATAPPVKTATTDKFLASRGPRFMQTFRRSQIAKRRSQRESQQTATGGKLLTPSIRPPNSMVLSKPVVRPIGLSLEATLAALATSTATGQTDISSPPPQPLANEDLGATIVSATVITAGPTTTTPTSCSFLADANSAAQNSLLKLNPTSSVDNISVPSSAVDIPIPAEDDNVLPADDAQCDSRTTSVAGSPPPDLSVLCADRSTTNLDICEPFSAGTSLSDDAASYSSAYPGYGNLSSTSEQGDNGSSYWMSAYYGAYGYESSMYGTSYPWYYGQLWYPRQQPYAPPVESDSVSPSFDAQSSGDESYGSYPPPLLPPDSCFPSTSPRAAFRPRPLFSPPYGSRPFIGPRPLFPITNRLRAPPHLSSEDDFPPPQKSPLRPLPVPPPGDDIPPSTTPTPLIRLSSGEQPAECRMVLGPQKKRFFVYSNNAELKAEVTVSIIG